LIWAAAKWIAGALAASAAVELITEGGSSCVADFQAGYNQCK
jgi:hypothetical protein